MFFLMCYTCVNMSCAICELVNDPSWRPTFRFYHWSVSLFAALLCVWMMFAMAPIVAAIAILFCATIFTYASYNSHNAKWGDGFQGMKFQLVKNILTRMELKAHTKNWRPQLLVIAEASINHDQTSDETAVTVDKPDLLKLASQLKNGRGFIILGGICCSKDVNLFSSDGLFMNPGKQQKIMDGLSLVPKLLKEYGIEGFGRIIHTDDHTAGLVSLIQNSGLGAFTPNSLLASWPSALALDTSDAGVKARSNLLSMVQVCEVFEKVLIIEKGKTWPQFDERIKGTIDIWWTFGGGGVLLLFPYLMSKHPVWAGCRTRLFVLAGADDDLVQMQKELDMYVHDFRLPIEVHIKVADDLVMAGMASTEKEPEEPGQEEAAPGERDPVLAVKTSHEELARTFSGNLVRTVSGADLAKTVSSWRERAHMENRDSKDPKTVLFLHHPVQLTLNIDCCPVEMAVASGLNELMLKISGDAELVVTNLPDMNPRQSALGYCQYVEELTKNMNRAVLLRGTNTEVITAFT
ncbi:unnamed protein product [Polarella glacialis]|uniref:Uncharacterized protein n=1 Tax=Polarella glacialis TaxID=89957 RepID=A0A813E855_POLGL|nr:unnamed protein product [Polarella glacialis]